LLVVLELTGKPMEIKSKSDARNQSVKYVAVEALPSYLGKARTKIVAEEGKKRKRKVAQTGKRVVTNRNDPEKGGADAGGVRTPRGQ